MVREGGRWVRWRVVRGGIGVEGVLVECLGLVYHIVRPRRI